MACSELCLRVEVGKPRFGGKQEGLGCGGNRQSDDCLALYICIPFNNAVCGGGQATLRKQKDMENANLDCRRIVALGNPRDLAHFLDQNTQGV